MGIADRILKPQAIAAILPHPIDHEPDSKKGGFAMTIELHTWNTPNGRKISVALEEMGVPYTVKPVNIGKGEQFAAAFVKISPNSRVMAINEMKELDIEPKNAK